MAWVPFRGERYLSMDEVEAWCEALAESHRDFVQLEEIGQSLQGRPLQLLSLGLPGPRPLDGRPGFWLDAGTHASEWSSVMSALFSISRWVEESQVDPGLRAWFEAHVIYVVPCVSPDGYQAMYEGAPFLRSSLRPPKEGTLRQGFTPKDMTGDGCVRWMRWRHPAGPFVEDPDVPLFMRPRRLDDPPEEAFFYCREGEFLGWDGVRWIAAPREFGLDLNRNFPGHWQPFRMFGMDGGDAPLSAPESRALLDAFRQRPQIAAALSNHTYTGAILTQPYRPKSPLSELDIQLMEALARDAVRHTDYDVLRVHPEFTYNPKQPIVGVWSDTISTLFGVPCYTLELWDPYGHCGVQVDRPAEFIRDPDPELLKQMLAHFVETGESQSWTAFEHPQLGPVELGGIDYLRSFRNPPTSHLAAECQKGHSVADQVRRALPRVELGAEVQELGGSMFRLQWVLENLGFLSTASLPRAEVLGLVPEPSVELELSEGLELLEGSQAQSLGHLDGWGAIRLSAGRHPIYPNLPARGHRATRSWILRGAGTLQLHWRAGRAGHGVMELQIG